MGGDKGTVRWECCTPNASDTLLAKVDFGVTLKFCKPTRRWPPTWRVAKCMCDTREVLRGPHEG